MRSNSEKSYRLTILLSPYLSCVFADIFESLGYEVLHKEYPEVPLLKYYLLYYKIDIALEWQWGPEDFFLLNLCKEFQPEAKVFLCLNWNGQPPSNWREKGYYDLLKVPFDLKEIQMKFNQLSKRNN